MSRCRCDGNGADSEPGRTFSLRKPDAECVPGWPDRDLLSWQRKHQLAVIARFGRVLVLIFVEAKMNFAALDIYDSQLHVADLQSLTHRQFNLPLVHCVTPHTGCETVMSRQEMARRGTPKGRRGYNAD
ncbi:MAG: hypothetical protein ACK5Q5_10985 [Planctomycetaceae bacterium]